MTPALALLAVCAFAASNICARRGALFAEPTQGVRLGVLMAPPAFLLATIVSGEFWDIGHVSFKALAFFSIAGLLHFVLGRSLVYLSIRSFGASRASVIVGLAPPISIALAVPIFGEDLGWALAVGGALVVFGPLLMTLGESRSYGADPRYANKLFSPDDMRRGALLGMAGAMFWAVSPILVKGALREDNLPTVGTLISYSAASLVVGGSLIPNGVRREFLAMSGDALWWYLLAGGFTTAAQLLNYLALSHGDVTVVVLLLQTIPLAVFALTWVINRRLEALNGAVVAGGVAVLFGTIIIVAQ